MCCQHAIESKLTRPKITRPKHKSAKDIYSVQFHNKAVEIMSLLYILNHTDLTHTLKGLKISFTTATVKWMQRDSNPKSLSL